MKKRMLSALAGAAAVPMVAATVLAPGAEARMQYGNYEVLSNRWTDASWVWAAFRCDVDGDWGMPNCLKMSAYPRPQFGAYYGGNAYLNDGKYSFTSPVADGLRCPGHAMPTTDTYTWDAYTLFGHVESRFDVGCFNGPPGMNTWTFALQRM